MTPENKIHVRMVRLEIDAVKKMVINASFLAGSRDSLLSNSKLKFQFSRIYDNEK